MNELFMQIERFRGRYQFAVLQISNVIQPQEDVQPNLRRNCCPIEWLQVLFLKKGTYCLLCGSHDGCNHWMTEGLPFCFRIFFNRFDNSAVVSVLLMLSPLGLEIQSSFNIRACFWIEEGECVILWRVFITLQIGFSGLRFLVSIADTDMSVVAVKGSI